MPTTERSVVDGIGGTFIYANDPDALAAWYARHLGLTAHWSMEGNHGRVIDPAGNGVMDLSNRSGVVWSILKAKAPLPADRGHYMINYRVLDLAGLLDQLRADGVEVEKEQADDYGAFAWIRDPEGNRIELWQPPETAPAV